jgi:hypothetical protein
MQTILILLELGKWNQKKAHREPLSKPIPAQRHASSAESEQNAQRDMITILMQVKG